MVKDNARHKKHFLCHSLKLFVCHVVMCDKNGNEVVDCKYCRQISDLFGINGYKVLILLGVSGNGSKGTVNTINVIYSNLNNTIRRN